jgi:2-haloacid dehalogenase
VDRWATFDCYGTLIDWNSGIRGELERLFGAAEAPGLLERYHALEPEIQAESPGSSYRDVMAAALARLAAERELDLPAAEADALGRSLPDWPVFGEVPTALAAARDEGWKLVILSNTDRDLIESSMKGIGVPFQFAIVASEIGSYKPAHPHWEAFFELSGAARSRHVHVAASLFHDVVPARELGLACVWINRLGERTEERPARELPNLSGLAEVLDELVPG